MPKKFMVGDIVEITNHDDSETGDECFISPTWAEALAIGQIIRIVEIRKTRKCHEFMEPEIEIVGIKEAVSYSFYPNNLELIGRPPIDCPQIMGQSICRDCTIASQCPYEQTSEPQGKKKLTKKKIKITKSAMLDRRQKQALEYFDIAVKLLGKNKDYEMANNMQQIQAIIEFGHDHIKTLQRIEDQKKLSEGGGK